MKNYRLFISGLDEKMDKGIPERHVVLLTGTPGTMKSSIAFNFLFKNAKAGVPGTYLSLEQDKANFQYHLANLGMGEIKGKLRLFDIATMRDTLEKMDTSHGKKMGLGILKKQIKAAAKGSQLLVIDSLPVIELLFSMKEPRTDMYHFFNWLKKLGITTIVITEMRHDSPNLSKNDIDFLADGIIKVSVENFTPTSAQRVIQIAKMRGVGHSPDPMSLNFKDGEFSAVKIVGM